MAMDVGMCTLRMSACPSLVWNTVSYVESLIFRVDGLRMGSVRYDEICCWRVYSELFDERRLILSLLFPPGFLDPQENMFDDG